MSSGFLPQIPSRQLPLQKAPTYVFFDPNTFGEIPPSQFTMDPTKVVNYYQPPATTKQIINWQDPPPGVLSNPTASTALLTGGTAALGAALAGPLGGALGGAAGPLIYSAITPGQESPRNIALQSGAGALGGGLGGAVLGPLGAGLGAGFGGYLGYRLSQNQPIF